MDKSAFLALKSQSTWRLVGLSFITYGVYTAYYIKRQSEVINEYSFPQKKISKDFILLIVNLAWVSLIFFLARYLVSTDLNEGNASRVVYVVSDLVDNLCTIASLVWAFMARNRVNSAFHFSPADSQWFHGFWTFMFAPLYFNYKINKICDSLFDSGDSGITNKRGRRD